MDLPPESQRFPPELRLRRGSDFERAFARRCSAGDERIILYACPNELPHSRLGLSVSRKVGGAVVRNRWRRLLREAFRLSRAKLPTGLDLVIVPRRQIEPTLAGLQESLVKLSTRLARRLNQR